MHAVGIKERLKDAPSPVPGTGWGGVGVRTKVRETDLEPALRKIPGF